MIGLKSDELRGDTVDYAALPSRGQMLRQMLNPFARRQLPNAPGVATVLLRSLMVRRERLSDSLERDDLLISPPLPDDASVMDWHRHAELAETCLRPHDEGHRLNAQEVIRYFAEDKNLGA